MTETTDIYTVGAIQDQVYTGKAIEPAVVVKKNGTVMTEGYAAAYTDNVNVGTASVTVTVGGHDETVAFRITQDPAPVVTMADVAVTYGTAYTVSPTAKTSAGCAISEKALTVRFYTNEDCTEGESLTQPVNAGSYWAKAVLKGTADYAEAGAVAKITITPGTFSVKAEGFSGDYDGLAHSITVTAGDAAVTYSETEDGVYTADNPAYTDAGSYTVYFKAVKANHYDVTGSVTVTIARIDQSLSYAESAVTGYQGVAAPDNALTHDIGDGDVTYTSGNTAVAVVKADGSLTLLSPGTTTITAVAAETVNYKRAEASFTLTVLANPLVSAGTLAEGRILVPALMTSLQEEALRAAVSSHPSFAGKTVLMQNLQLINKEDGTVIHDEAVTFTLAYPEGITKDNYQKYDFVVMHLLEDGTTEILSCTPTAGGLQITSTLSAFAVGYALKPVTVSHNTTAGNTPAARPFGTVLTADNTYLLLWIVLMVGSVLIIAAGVTLFGKKKGGRREL